MKTLDRYIIRTFLINFAILLVVMMSLFVVVDLIVDLDEFLQAGEQRADEFGGMIPATLFTIADYYGPIVVLLYVFFSGLLVVAAMGFTLSAMMRARELTAIVASGLSLYRVATPILVVGIGLNLLALPCQEWIIPAVASKLARSKSDVEHETISRFPVHYAVDQQGNLVSAAAYDPEAGTLTGVTIIVRDEQGLMKRSITADTARWQDRPEGWRLTGGKVAVLAGPNPLRSPPTDIDFFATTLSPTVLLARNATIYPRLLPLGELQALEANPAVEPLQRAKITQIIWSRFSLLVMNVLVLVMGLPFFLLRSPRNLLVQGIKAAGVCLGAWGGGMVMLQVSAGYLNPVAAAWLPVVIYLPVSAVLLQTIKT